MAKSSAVHSRKQFFAVLPFRRPCRGWAAATDAWAVIMTAVCSGSLFLALVISSPAVIPGRRVSVMVMIRPQPFSSHVSIADPSMPAGLTTRPGLENPFLSGTLRVPLTLTRSIHRLMVFRRQVYKKCRPLPPLAFHSYCPIMLPDYTITYA